MIKKLKEKVKFCLEKYPETRDSDITLTIKIWETYNYNKLLKREADGKTYVALDSLYDLPREDNIKRIRANFQTKGLYLPTSLEVAKQRRINMDIWHKEMAFNN